MSNPHKDRAREEKAKKLARVIVREMVTVTRGLDDSYWKVLTLRAGVTEPSEQTRRRVVEILEGIAI